MCKRGTVEVLEYDNKRFDVDKCIVPLVKALNDAGIKTVASCCGHKKIYGNIALADGRELLIAEGYKQARKFEQFQAENERLKEPCEWKYDESYDMWETECGGAFTLLKGTPKDNLMKYCPYCGKQIKQALRTES